MTTAEQEKIPDVNIIHDEEAQPKVDVHTQNPSEAIEIVLHHELGLN